MNINIPLLIVISTALIISLLAILIALYSSKRIRRYNQDLHRAELEMYRDNIEKKLYGLTKQLTASEERWRDLNHLLLTSQKILNEEDFVAKKPTFSDFLKGLGLRKDELEIENDLVVVLMPFNDEFIPVYKRIVAICSSVGLRCYRGDEEFVRTDILSHIIKLIVRARIVLSVIDGRNPNVFYELGIAHGIDKKTLLISKTLKKLPFDIKVRRIILYENLEDLEKKLKLELTKILVKP